MNVDNVFIFAEETNDLFFRASLLFGTLLGVGGILTNMVLRDKGKIPQHLAVTGIVVCAAAAAAVPATGMGLAYGEKAEISAEATGWMLDEYGLTVIEPEETDPKDSLLDYEVIVTEDQSGEVHLVRLQPVTEGMTVDGEAVRAGEGFFLLDPETGEEFESEDER